MKRWAAGSPRRDGPGIAQYHPVRTHSVIIIIPNKYLAPSISVRNAAALSTGGALNIDALDLR
jgi:hypothetical protein